MSALTAEERRGVDGLIELARRHRETFGRQRSGLGVAALETLLVIARDGPVAQAAVARELGRDRAAVSRGITELEEKGLVRPAGSRPSRPIYQMTPTGLRLIRTTLR